MDFWRSILDLARRRFIGPPIVALAVGAAVAAYLLTPTRYVTTASMLLTTPAAGGTLNTDPDIPVGLTNPLLQFSDGLRTTAGMLILTMNGPAAQRDIGVVKDGPTAVTIDDGRSNPDLLGISSNGPYIYVEVDSESPATARAVMTRARHRISTELVERQRALRAPDSTHISILDVVPPIVPEPQTEDKVQAGGVGLMVTLGLGFGAAYFAQRHGLLGRRRKAPAEEGTPVAETLPAPDEETVATPAAEDAEQAEEQQHEDGTGDGDREDDGSNEGEGEDRELLIMDDGMPTGPIGVVRVGVDDRGRD